MSGKQTIRPHPGPQEMFLSTPADIAIYGGAAGGGKSWALLLECLRHSGTRGFSAVVFRQTSKQVRTAGSLWDESMKLYPQAGGTPREYMLEWTFPSGARISFAHMDHESTKLEYQGSQITLICWDELTHFSETQFWYLLSRNRSMCGVRPYVRATTNPDADSWVASLISWWIDQETGFPIRERAGVLRWFIRLNNEVIWDDDPEALRRRFPDNEPKSLTFIPAALDDNPTLTKTDPGYRANLQALPLVEQQRLLGGNWKIRMIAGMFFQVSKIQVVQVEPAGLECCRGWDLAATKGSGDWTVGIKVGRGNDGLFYICDMIRGQWEANERDQHILQAAQMDGFGCMVRLPQDPGAAGKSEAQRLTRMLAGYNVKCEPISGDKEVRARGVAAQINGGTFRMVSAHWNRGLLERLDAFPTKGVPDDDVDALADAFNSVLELANLSAFLDKGFF
jgi:predicted phage terminase large subunit-like protein